MKLFRPIKSYFTVIARYRYKWLLFIALSWTLIDVFFWVKFMRQPLEARYDTTFNSLTPEAFLLRILIVLLMSAAMGYLLIFRLKRMYRNYPLFLNLLMKTGILLSASLIMSFLIHFSYSIFILDSGIVAGLRNFIHDSFSTSWLFDTAILWMVIFIVTQLLIEIDEKYSPGVFIDILTGKYIQPKNENRIIMFIDLKDSTTIAEQLGHKRYFRFIRDFIYYLSIALLENGGRIYQYVGDEIVVSWPYSKENVKKSLRALLEARKLLNRYGEKFKRRYGQVPEYKVGVHIGEVTVGEIGVIKKDLAMSGDTMNTTARIRNSCTELKQKFIVSKNFADELDVQRWQVESLGCIELKGKVNKIELFALKI